MKWFLAAVFAADLVAAAYLIRRRRLAAARQRAWDAEELAYKEACEKMDEEHSELLTKLADGRHRLIVEWLETIDGKLDNVLKIVNQTSAAPMGL